MGRNRLPVKSLMKANPLSRTVMMTVSGMLVVMMMFLGTLTKRMGTGISFSYISSSVMESQNAALRNRKNKNTRNRLDTKSSKKFLMGAVIRLSCLSMCDCG